MIELQQNAIYISGYYKFLITFYIVLNNNNFSKIKLIELISCIHKLKSQSYFIAVRVKG